MNLLNIIVVCCLLSSGAVGNEVISLNETVDYLLSSEMPECQNIDPMDMDDVSMTFMGIKVNVTKSKLYGTKSSVREGDCTMTTKDDGEVEMKMTISNTKARQTCLLTGGPLKNAPCECTAGRVVLELLLISKSGEKPKLVQVKILQLEDIKIHIDKLPKALAAIVNRLMGQLEKKMHGFMKKMLFVVMDKVMAECLGSFS